MFDVVSLLFGLFISTAHAQNVTCATRAPGDSTNACASTAFVHGGFQPTLPNFSAGNPLIGNGTNIPTQGTKQGTSTVFPVVDGTHVNGQCAVWTASGGLSSIACTASGSGTVGAGSIGQFAGYIANGTSVVGVPNVCVPIQMFGGVADGSTDNVAAYDAWYTALGGASGCLSFPPGSYLFSAKETKTLAADQVLTFNGAGGGASELYFPNAAGGYQFNWASTGNHNPSNGVNINNLDITTGQVAGGTALTFNNDQPTLNYAWEPITLTNVTLRGHDGRLVTDRWTTGFSVIGVSGLATNNVVVYGASTAGGTGMILSGFNTPATTNGTTSTSSNVLHFASTTGIIQNQVFYDLTVPSAGNNVIQVSSVTGTTVTLSGNVLANVGSGDSIVFTTPGIVYNLQGYAEFNMGQGMNIQSGIQGVTINQSNFTGGSIGLIVGANQVGLVELTVSNSQFNTVQSQISLGSPFADVLIANNLFFGADATNINPTLNLITMQRFSITGNHILNVGGNTGAQGGVSVGATNGGGGILTGNWIGGYVNGISLASTTKGVNVQSNVYIGATNQVVNSGGTACPASPTGNCLGGGSQ